MFHIVSLFVFRGDGLNSSGTKTDFQPGSLSLNVFIARGKRNQRGVGSAAVCLNLRWSEDLQRCLVEDVHGCVGLKGLLHGLQSLLVSVGVVMVEDVSHEEQMGRR